MRSLSSAACVAHDLCREKGDHSASRQFTKYMRPAFGGSRAAPSLPPPLSSSLLLALPAALELEEEASKSKTGRVAALDSQAVTMGVMTVFKSSSKAAVASSPGSPATGSGRAQTSLLVG
jgi:hypothetical protein